MDRIATSARHGWCEMSDQIIPTLWARLGGKSGTLLLVWCKFCRREHQHGAGSEVLRGGPPRDGHRVAHCKAYDRTGYIIETHDVTAAEIRAYNEGVK